MDTDIPSDFYFVLFFGVSVFSLVVIDEYFNRHGVDLKYKSSFLLFYAVLVFKRKKRLRR